MGIPHASLEEGMPEDCANIKLIQPEEDSVCIMLRSTPSILIFFTSLVLASVYAAPGGDYFSHFPSSYIPDPEEIGPHPAEYDFPQEESDSRPAQSDSPQEESDSRPAQSDSPQEEIDSRPAQSDSPQEQIDPQRVQSGSPQEGQIDSQRVQSGSSEEQSNPSQGQLEIPRDAEVPDRRSISPEEESDLDTDASHHGYHAYAYYKPYWSGYYGNGWGSRVYGYGAWGGRGHGWKSYYWY